MLYLVLSEQQNENMLLHKITAGLAIAGPQWPIQYIKISNSKLSK